MTNYKNHRNSQNLTEVKKGETGSGLLIEHDGHIIGNKDMVSQIKEDIAHHKEFVIPDRFTVSAVFQKYGIKNANGRIYPEAVLKREVENYINTRVRTRSAIAALDHPECQLADTQVLTEKGWVYIPEVKVGDNILTLKENGDIEVSDVYRKIESPYKGEMYHITGRFIDITVTPNHKFPIYGRDKKFKGFYTAEQIYNNEVPGLSHCSIPKTGNWTAVSDESFTIPRLTEEEMSGIHKKDLIAKYSQDLVIPMDVWMKFMGIYLSEGNAKGVDAVSIYQVKKEVCDEIEAMLDEFPLEHTIRRYESKNGKITTIYSIFDMRLCKYLKQFGICYDKYVPYEIKKQGKDMLRIFYDWFVMGDGRKRGLGHGNYYSDDVFSTSKQLVMDLNEIQLKIGYCGSYHVEDRHYDRLIEGRVIKGENSQNMHFSHRQHTKYISLQPKSFKIEKIDYEGMVYCLEVKNHTFYTMCHNGFCLWSGNSSTLSGHDVAHVITNLEWQGRTLIGEMDLHLSPGYRRYGVCSTSGDLVANLILDDILIGVSSRAVGSVEEKLGVLLVGDDLELLAFDVVMENSTPGAKIGLSREDLQQYIESDETNKNKPLVNEKLERVKKILL